MAICIMRTYVYIIVLLCGILASEFVFGAAKIIKEKKSTKQKYYFDLNTKKSFSNVKPLKAYAFLVGNDDYSLESKFTKLYQCVNDVRLLKSLLIYCAKVDKEDIFVNVDLTLKEFKKRFSDFLKHIKNDDPEAEKVVIIQYSGHGNVDGSLVFIDGGMFKPQKLKDAVNSYKNDTILILDACYSGNNEGPKDAFKKKKQGFKSNSLRIYASLAHVTAKEIKYTSGFFRVVKPFYSEVLGLDAIEGNGYFTGMVGLFFAEYKLKPDENISFKNLIEYVTNKGKQYVEYLALRQGSSNRFEAGVRLNQQPKLLPMKEKVDYLDINHQFILIQKPIVPLGLEPGIAGGLFFPVSSNSGDFSGSGLFVDVFLGYELKFLIDNLFASANINFMTIDSSSGFTATRRTVGLTILAPSAGVYYRFFRKSFFNLLVGADGGIAMTFMSASSYGPLSETSETFFNTYISGNIGANFELFRDFDLFLQNKLFYIGYTDYTFMAISIIAGASYHF